MVAPQTGTSYFLQIGAAGTTDVDVTDHVRKFDVRRGRDRETDDYSPASGTMTLQDVDRRYDPNNPSSAYVGGITPLRKVRAQLAGVAENSLRLTGVTGSQVSTTDVAAFAITNIDVRWFGTLDDWQSGTQTIANQWDETGANRSWIIQARTTGIRVSLSVDGTAVLATSDYAVPFSDGDFGGIRFTRTQATGVTTVYFSTDGIVWASAGTNALSAGNALFNSTAQLRVGEETSFFPNPATGNVQWMEVRNGIDGTVVANPDFRPLLAGQNLLTDPFTDDQGNVWAGLGFGTLIASGSNIFTGYVTDWSIDYMDGDTISIVTVTFTDALGLLGNAELDTITPAHNGDTSGVRVARVLNRAEVAYTEPTSIDAGRSVFGNTTYGTNALSYLQECVKAEGGYLFVDRNGTLQFRNRHALLNDSTADFEFTDDPDAADIGYRRITQSSAADLLYNRVTGAGTTGLEQAVGDTASQTMYKIRTLPMGSLLLSSDSEVLSLLQWKLQRFKDPEARFESIELVTMAKTAAEAEAIALLDLATLVLVKRTPLGAGSEISRVCIVDKVEHSITSKNWTTTIGLSNADTRPFLVLDHLTLGKLDSNRLSF